MAKADLTLADGTKVVIEGSPEEVASLLQRFSGDHSREAAEDRSKSRKARGRRSGANADTARATGAIAYIRELIEEDFFESRRGLGDVKAALEERAHIYPVTTLSPSLFRLVRSRELRRLKGDDGQWKYVNP